MVGRLISEIRQVSVHPTRLQVLREFERSIDEMAEAYRLFAYKAPGYEVATHLRSDSTHSAYPTVIGKLKPGVEFWRLPILVADVRMVGPGEIRVKTNDPRFSYDALENSFARALSVLQNVKKTEPQLSVTRLDKIDYIAGRAIGKYS